MNQSNELEIDSCGPKFPCWYAFHSLSIHKVVQFSLGDVDRTTLAIYRLFILQNKMKKTPLMNRTTGVMMCEPPETTRCNCLSFLCLCGRCRKIKLITRFLPQINAIPFIKPRFNPKSCQHHLSVFFVRAQRGERLAAPVFGPRMCHCQGSAGALPQ